MPTSLCITGVYRPVPDLDAGKVSAFLDSMLQPMRNRIESRGRDIRIRLKIRRSVPSFFHELAEFRII